MSSVEFVSSLALGLEKIFLFHFWQLVWKKVSSLALGTNLVQEA
jgi:hypothetical protein